MPTGDPARHCPDVSRTRVLQEEGRRRPRGLVQRHEGLLHPRPGGRLLSGVGLYRRPSPYAGLSQCLKTVVNIIYVVVA